jgi:hypothetical protein
VSPAVLERDPLMSPDAPTREALPRAHGASVPEPGQRDPDLGTSESGFHQDDGFGTRLGGVQSLDEVITSAWRSLKRGETTSCPVCAGAVEAWHFEGAERLEAACASCGSELW